MTGRDYSWLVGAAHDAGRRLLSSWPGLMAPETRPMPAVRVKRDGSLVTEADRDSERILVSALLRAVPEAVVVSEEDEETHGCVAETVWFIDPLDGTRNYLDGSSDFAVLISCWTSGEPDLSVVLFPVEGLLGVADGAHASFVPPVSVPSRRLVHAAYCDPPGLRARLPPGTDYAVDRFESTRALFDVARGQAAGAVVLMCGHHAWDIAAPLHLIAAVGGVVTDDSGDPIRLRSREVEVRYIVAANEATLHALLLDALAQSTDLRQERLYTPREVDNMSVDPFLTPVADDWSDHFFDDGFEPTFRALGKYDSTLEDLDNLLGLLQLAPGARILDVPCGFGRHAGPLAERGFAVVGIDISEQQIALGRAKWPKVAFHVRDMRNPPSGPFDAVFSLWSSFGFLDSREEDVRALVSWRGCMAPGGSLVMELTTLERAQFENRKADEAVSTKSVERNGVREDAWYDWETQTSNVRYSRPGWSRECRTRMYSREQLAVVLREAGFVDIRMMGDFRGGPLHPANRTIVIAAAPRDGKEEAA